MKELDAQEPDPGIGSGSGAIPLATRTNLYCKQRPLKTWRSRGSSGHGVLRLGRGFSLCVSRSLQVALLKAVTLSPLGLVIITPPLTTSLQGLSTGPRFEVRSQVGCLFSRHSSSKQLLGAALPEALGLKP